jgi:hypothetical protein
MMRQLAAGGVMALALAWSGARAEDDVLVNIRGPLVGRVGEKVAFDVELVNRSGRSLEKLRVIDYFDSGFRHEASASPIEQKGTIDLAVGTARRVTLEFTLAEPGRQCHRVEILDPSHRFVGGATECVQVSGDVPSVAQQPSAVPPLQPSPTPAPAPPLASPPPLITPPPAPANVPVPVPSPFPAATASVTPTVPLEAPPAVPLAPAVPQAPAAPALSLDLSGPIDAVSGSVTEYVATVRNTGNAPSAPSSLHISWDDPMVPLEASDGYSLASSRVSWNLPEIEPGGQLKRQVNLRAQAAADAYSDSPPTRACVRSELAGLAGGAMVGDQECLQVRATRQRPRLLTPSEAGLRLSLADLDDPVRIGDATTLVCTVVNDGEAASGPLSLVIDLPQGARLVGDARARVDDGRVFFDSIDVPPGRRQSVEVTYKLTAAGRGTAVATLTGTNLDGRLDRTCHTEFIAP